MTGAGAELPRVPLSLALIGLGGAAPVREQIELARELGYRSVQLNAAAAGVRPRELGRSARRDLAALLRRNELSSAGVDLWIPEAHYTDPVHSDRAIGAACEAAVFAAELAQLTGGRGVLSLTLPAGAGAEGAAGTIAQRALEAGAMVADHRWPAREGVTGGALGVGIDPATVLLAGADPAGAVSACAGALVSARLSDLTSVGRVSPGTGRLDLLRYLVAVVTCGYRGEVVLDLRGVAGARAVAEDVARRCGRASAGPV